MKKANLQRIQEISMTPRQRKLAKKSGTPSEFAQAVYKCVPGDISMDEARAAVDRYNAEWAEAGLSAKDKKRVEIKAALEVMAHYDEQLKAALEARTNAVRCIKRATRRNDLTTQEALQIWKIAQESPKLSAHLKN